MTEWQIPIKCSTVKKLDEYLPILILIEANIWGIWSLVVAGTTRAPIAGTLIEQIYVLAVSCGIILGAGAIIADAVIVYEILPSLTCIKDEEDKP